jgi:hypothetical protein
MLSLILLVAAVWIALDMLVVGTWVVAAYVVRHRGRPVPALLDVRALRRPVETTSLRRSA